MCVISGNGEMAIHLLTYNPYNYYGCTARSLIEVLQQSLRDVKRKEL